MSHGIRTGGPDGDAVLVGDIVGGSEGALAELYDRHATMVYRVAMAVDRDPGAAEEIVQETFLALWNRAERFDPGRGTLAGWLATIARNRAIDRLRATGRRLRAAPFSALTAGLDEEEPAVEWLVASGELVGAGRPEPGPERFLDEQESAAVLASAMTGLTGAERETILLAYRDGLTQSEIAARLGWPLGTVKTRSRRALRRLRETLATADEPDQPAFGARAMLPRPVPCYEIPC
jgi:RNA polymerase sigma-70 factor (ECF subfamily)